MTAYPAVGSQFGQYEISGVLGQGGMGVVFSAVHQNLGRRVALKVLSPDLASRPEFRRRFEREASALARLYSPHIIDVYDYGEVGEWLFIATQLVAGRDLRDWLAHEGPMPPSEALGVVAQIAAALADAHDAGIIHRDIKPSNILLHQSTDELYAYVCDFGISQTIDEERTRTGGVIGTYAYMAPERHEGSDATVASDVYALGCLLHAALTGRPPYEGTDVQVAMQHLHGDIPEYVGPEPASTAINAILRRCLAKKPGERYPSASALRSDLLGAQKTIAESDDLGRLPEAAARPQARSRRRLVLAAAGAIVTVAVVTAAVLIVPGLLSQDPSCPRGTSAGADGACRSPSSAPTTATGVTCWDGQQAEKPSDCSEPVGRDGLRWAFPSLDRDFAGCYRVFDAVRTSKPDASLRTWFCPTPGGRFFGIGYTEWSSVQGAKRHFTRVFGDPSHGFIVAGFDNGYLWSPSEPNDRGFYKAARLYRDFPLSATVWAKTPKGVARICSSLTARSMGTFETDPVNCQTAS
jgi:serine/threonine-protein kinase